MARELAHVSPRAWRSCGILQFALTPAWATCPPLIGSPRLAMRHRAIRALATARKSRASLQIRLAKTRRFQTMRAMLPARQPRASWPHPAGAKNAGEIETRRRGEYIRAKNAVDWVKEAAAQGVKIERAPPPVVADGSFEAYARQNGFWNEKDGDVLALERHRKAVDKCRLLLVHDPAINASWMAEATTRAMHGRIYRSTGGNIVNVVRRAGKRGIFRSFRSRGLRLRKPAGQSSWNRNYGRKAAGCVHTAFRHFLQGNQRAG